MAKFKVTLTARSGKERPTISVVVEAENAKDAQKYVMRAIAPIPKYEIEEVTARQTLRAAQ